MKKILLILTVLFTANFCHAQDDLTFPFQGGAPVLNRFFADNIVITPDLKAAKANGMAIFKFTADDKGVISKIVVYYADDIILTGPIIEALKKSNRKWIIPNHEKFHDFILPFTINFNIPTTGNGAVQSAYYEFFLHHKPVNAPDQIPLNEASLLPAVIIKYDL